MTWLEFIILTICVVLVFLPPRYDPAIRFKEWVTKDEEE